MAKKSAFKGIIGPQRDDVLKKIILRVTHKENVADSKQEKHRKLCFFVNECE